MPLKRNAQLAYDDGTLYLAIKATQTTVPDNTKRTLPLLRGTMVAKPCCCCCATSSHALPCFNAAFDTSIAESDNRQGFRGAGLVPHNPDAVILKLRVRLCTPLLASVDHSTRHS
jgi:hypothetical protein